MKQPGQPQNRRSLMNIVKMMCVIVNVTEANRVVSVIVSTRGGFCVSAKKTGYQEYQAGKSSKLFNLREDWRGRCRRKFSPHLYPTVLNITCKLSFV